MAKSALARAVTLCRRFASLSCADSVFRRHSAAATFSSPAAAASSTDSSEKASASEPPEIRQLRLQIHQYQGVIDQATSDQKRLQSQINVYQSRTAMSPGIEEQYKLLTRDNDNAQAFYKDLLAKKSSAEVGSSMENQQEGEQMNIIASASLPESPSFPNRPLLAAGGLAAGLGLGLLLAIRVEHGRHLSRSASSGQAPEDDVAFD